MNYLSDDDINHWIDNGKNLNYNYLLIVKDLEDKDYFPVYFMTSAEVVKYKNNIISESKLELIKIVNIEQG